MSNLISRCGLSCNGANLKVQDKICGKRPDSFASNTLGTGAERVRALDRRGLRIDPVIKNGREIWSNLKRGKALLQVADKRPLFGQPSAEGVVRETRATSASAVRSPAPHNRPLNGRIRQLNLHKLATRRTETG